MRSCNSCADNSFWGARPALGSGTERCKGSTPFVRIHLHVLILVEIRPHYLSQQPELSFYFLQQSRRIVQLSRARLRLELPQRRNDGFHPECRAAAGAGMRDAIRGCGIAARDCLAKVLDLLRGRLEVDLQELAQLRQIIARTISKALNVNRIIRRQCGVGHSTPEREILELGTIAR